MKILMRGNSTNQDYDADISFVFVDLYPALARLMLKRIAEFKRLKKKDSSALETYYWNHEAVYLSYGQVSEKEQKAVNTDLIVDATTKITFEDGQRVECNQMIVSDDCVYFTAIPKHSSIYIQSEQIPLKTIREAATKKKMKRAA